MFGDRYRTEGQPIGHGGMGVVYKAFDNVTKRFVALKTLKGEVDDASLELFQREWSVLAQLCHPNIVDVLDIGNYTEGGQQKPYFVMPLLPGCTLNKLINEGGSKLTVERVVEIVSQASRGLQAAHDRGLIHRDLKPSNLFVMNDDTVKIIDFGIVHLVDAESRTSIKGTLHYMAPEQLEMKPASARSDIYSLGVVCYEALTGRKPFERATEDEVVQAIRAHMPAPVSELNSSINDLVSRVVHKAIAKQPYHRFSSVREFSDLLQRSLRNEHIELFDRARIQPRINRINRALKEGDYPLAVDILDELQSEGNIDPEMPVLRVRAEQYTRSKIIYQLLESARTRKEEGEHPLALQDIQRVLDIDPGNVDASVLKSEIERQRSATQIDKWLQIGRQHRDNKLFTKARQAVDEVLTIDPSNRLARGLLEEVSKGEQEASRLRQEKQRLYEAALKSYRNGEISSALKRLEEVIEAGKRAPGHPDTEAQYLAFYDEVRSEHDESLRLYAEGKSALALREFSKAREICSDVLRRRPREPLFKALQIEIEDLQRQENSAAISHLYSQIESEADLDRKFALLSDANKQFPEEQMFAQSLKLVKERRDLVNSIVARARHYESQGALSEASNQWDVLRSVYSQHPGLEFEIQRLIRKQEVQAQEGARARWVEAIDRAILLREWNRAQELVLGALAEAPGDGELLQLQQQVAENAQRDSESMVLLAESEACAAAGDHENSIQKLRTARALHCENSAIIDALSSALVGHARNLAERDWRAAVPFIEEALEIDPSDPGALSVSRLLQDVRQREQIERYLMEARDFQTQHKLTAALQKVEQGLRDYPGEIRLLQLRNVLSGALEAQSAAAARKSESGAVPVERAFAATASAGSANMETRNLFDATRMLSSDGGGQIDRQAAGTSLSAPVTTPRLRLLPERLSTRKSGRPWKLIAGIAAGLIVCGFLFQLAVRRDDNRIVTGQEPVSPSAATASVPEVLAPDNVAPAAEESHPLPSASKPPAGFYVDFTSNPSPAKVVVDNQPRWTCLTPCPLELSRGPHSVTVSAPIYVSQQQMIQVPDDVTLAVTLVEEPKQVHLISDPPGASLTLDGEVKGVTPITLSLTPGQHKIVLSKDNLTAEKTLEIGRDSSPFLVLRLTSDASPAEKPN